MTIQYQFKTEREVIQAAKAIFERRARKYKRVLTSTEAAREILRDYLQCALDSEREHFMLITLDNGHAMIDAKIMFSGTINGASVHPREIVRKALMDNAAAIIIAHNHPSGRNEPSGADHTITKLIVDACKTFDIHVLDHMIVGDTILSFAEKGYI